MKNTFAVTTTLLLALALGGSYAGFRLATAPRSEEASAAAPTQTEGVNTSEGVPSAQTSSTGAAGAPAAQGNTVPETTRGVARGQSGAVQVPEGTAAGVVDGASGGAGSGQSGGSGGSDVPGTDQGNPPTAGAQNSGAVGGPNTQGESVASPTAQGSEGTQVGQTGSTVTETATAASGGISDSKAAEVTSALTGNTSEGLKKFTATCSGCHGAQGGGGIGPALNTAKGPGSWNVAQFEAAVRQGHAPDRELSAVMPRFTQAQVSQEDLVDIYAYLKTLPQ